MPFLHRTSAWPGRLCAALVALLALCACAPLPRADAIPRQADGRPDLSGLWQALSSAEWNLEPHAARQDAPAGVGVVVGNTIPYTPEALQKRNANFAKRESADPRLKCFWPGVPRINYTPLPFQIFQSPKQLSFAYEYAHAVRTIHANGTPHPKGPINWWLGDSRGHWEGDTLVVDVVHFTDQTWLDRSGNFHGEDLHVVERYRLVDADHIAYEATLDDPATYTRPWTLQLLLYRIKEKNVRLLENECYTFAYEKFYP
jgi:hypothetical protein